MTQGKCIIIDDDPIVGTIIADILKEVGHRPQVFTAPCEALDYILANPAMIRMVISDNDMPGMQGMELLRQVRSRYPRLPLLLISARSPQLLDPWLPFLPKPFRVEGLITTVTDLLSGRLAGSGKAAPTAEVA